MIIFEPERTAVEDRVRVSARVEFRKPPAYVPAELFFELPEARTDWVSDHSDAFLTALLLPAMQQGEDVEVRGAVSPRLLFGLNEYQRAFNAWFPWRFQRVTVTCRDEAGAEAPATGGAVVTAFSGGVDSFYSLWCHLPQNDADPRSAVSAALFVHGFDIVLEKEGAYREVYDAYGRLFAELGLELVSARTNAQSFAAPGNWGVFHGAPLGAAAQVLGRGITRFYVPASHTYNDLVAWGSDPRIDHLLSTETLQVVHDGAGATRIAKTEAIDRWPATFGRLRVCAPSADRGAFVNCGRCEKCVRTMLALDMNGTLALQTSFPQRLERRTVRGCYYNVASDFAFAHELVAHAKSRGRRDVVVDLTWAIARSRVAVWLRPTFRRVRRRLRALRAALAAAATGRRRR